jgi:hypothetical protein
VIARNDQHQFLILSFNFFSGNPFIRNSMTFNITFEDGTITMPYGGDFIFSQQFEEYVSSLPILYPLRFPAKLALREVRKLEKLAITDIEPAMDAFVDLRIYDGRSSTWFDSLSLPDTRPYITRIIFTRWTNSNNQRQVTAVVPFFGVNHPKYKLFLTAYDIMAYVHMDQPYWTTILLEDKHRRQFPQILRS